MVATRTTSDGVVMEYLRNSLGGNLRHIIHGAKDCQEAWSRLDERYADRYRPKKNLDDPDKEVDCTTHLKGVRLEA